MNNIFYKKTSLVKLIIFFALFIISLIFFISITEEIFDKESLYYVDMIIQNIALLFVSPSITKFMIVVTYLWSIYFLWVLSIFILFYLWKIKKSKYVIFYLFTLGIWEIIIHWLKFFFQRERPLESIVPGIGYSYPSGHAFSTMLVFWLIIFLSSVFITNWKIKFYIFFLCICIIIGVWFSRIYLWVHWFSDVVWWYVVAFSWLMLCINLFRFRKYRNS